MMISEKDLIKLLRHSCGSRRRAKVLVDKAFPPQQQATPTLDKAVAFLEQNLSTHPVRVSTLTKRAKTKGITARTLRRAATQIRNLETSTTGFGKDRVGRWWIKG